MTENRSGGLGRSEVVREGVTAALYISLSLLAILVALPPSFGVAESETPALFVFLDSVALILAHQVAFRISSRLVHGHLTAESLELLGAHLTGGIVVMVVAVAPFLVLEGATAVLVSELALLALVGVVAYAAARNGAASRVRALGYVAAIAGLTLVLLWLKTVMGH